MTHNYISVIQVHCLVIMQQSGLLQLDRSGEAWIVFIRTTSFCLLVSTFFNLRYEYLLISLLDIISFSDPIFKDV